MFTWRYTWLRPCPKFGQPLQVALFEHIGNSYLVFPIPALHKSRLQGLPSRFFHQPQNFRATIGQSGRHRQWAVLPRSKGALWGSYLYPIQFIQLCKKQISSGNIFLDYIIKIFLRGFQCSLTGNLCKGWWR